MKKQDAKNCVQRQKMETRKRKEKLARAFSLIMVAVTIFTGGNVTALAATENTEKTVESEMQTAESDAVRSIQSRIDALPTVDGFIGMADGTTTEDSRLSQAQLDVYNETQAIAEELDCLPEEEQDQIDISKLMNLCEYFNRQVEYTTNYSDKALYVTMDMGTGDTGTGTLTSVEYRFSTTDTSTGGQWHLYLWDKKTQATLAETSLGAIENGSHQMKIEYTGTPGTEYMIGMVLRGNEYSLRKTSEFPECKDWPNMEWICDPENFSGVTNVYLNGVKIDKTFSEILKIEHDHTWKYEASSNTIKARCSDVYCGYELTLELNAVYRPYSGKAYDGIEIINNITDVTGETQGEITYYLSDGTTKTNKENSGAAGEGTAPVNVGSYIAKISIGGATATASFQIEKAEISPEVLIAGWKYGETAKTPSVTVKAGSNDITSLYDASQITYTYYTDANCQNETTSANGTGANGAVPKNAGTYYVKAVVEEIADYAEGSGVTAFTIEPAEVTVRVDNASKHIGKADPEFTYKVTGLVDGDSLKDIIIKRDKGEMAGDYTVTATAEAASNPNYNVTYVTGKLIIEDHIWSGWAAYGNREKSTCSKCGQIKYRMMDTTDSAKIEKEAEVAPGSPFTEAMLKNSNSELIAAGVIFTEEERIAIRNGSDARVWIEISDRTEASDAEKQKVEAEARKIMGIDISKVVYFDVNLFKTVEQNGTTSKKQITAPGAEIEISIKLPDRLIQEDSSISRVYKVIRLHNSQVDRLDADFDKKTGTITFKTNKFSTYAIAFTDTQSDPDITEDTPYDEDNNNSSSDTKDDPVSTVDHKDNTADSKAGNQSVTAAKTGDSFDLAFWTILLMISGAGIVGTLKRRKRKECK